MHHHHGNVIRAGQLRRPNQGCPWNPTLSAVSSSLSLVVVEWIESPDDTMIIHDNKQSSTPELTSIQEWNLLTMAVQLCVLLLNLCVCLTLWNVREKQCRKGKSTEFFQQLKRHGNITMIRERRKPLLCQLLCSQCDRENVLVDWGHEACSRLSGN